MCPIVHFSVFSCILISVIDSGVSSNVVLRETSMLRTLKFCDGRLGVTVRSFTYLVDSFNINLLFEFDVW